MKRFILFAVLFIFHISALAQPGRFRPEQMNDEEIIKMQTSDIVRHLGLEGSTKDKFVKEYTVFRKEIDAIAHKALPPKMTDNEEDIEKSILQNFEVSEQILQIRKKYYARLRNFLKPSQIQMMYRIENEAGRRFHERPGGPEGPGPKDGPKGPGEPGERPMPGHRDGGRF